MSQIVIISGSLSENSGTEKILHYIGDLLQQEGVFVKHFSVKDISPEVLCKGRYDEIEIIEIAKELHDSIGVIVGSPVYKASLSGVLKAFLDVLPQDALRNKPVLPIMTGGSMAHLLAIEYALKPVLASLKGLNTKGLYFIDKQIDKESLFPIKDEEALQRTKRELSSFVQLANRSANMLY